MKTPLKMNNTILGAAISKYVILGLWCCVFVWCISFIAKLKILEFETRGMDGFILLAHQFLMEMMIFTAGIFVLHKVLKYWLSTTRIISFAGRHGYTSKKQAWIIYLLHQIYLYFLISLIIILPFIVFME